MVEVYTDRGIEMNLGSDLQFLDKQRDKLPYYVKLDPLCRRGILNEIESTRDRKDPCIVFDGSKWHIFGSGGSTESETWRIVHSTAIAPEGPWAGSEMVAMHGGDLTIHGVAPGVIYDGDRFHIFAQTDYAAYGGRIEYLVSQDGSDFYYVNTSLESIGGNEAGIYDSHPFKKGDDLYLVYSGFPSAEPGKPQVSHGDIYLAKSLSGSWAGPWKREGRILSHQEVSHHNQHDHHDYEWGLEGAQLVELPNGLILLNAVCFLPDQPRGKRQRIFFALADNVYGQYSSIGPLLAPVPDSWESEENGHASCVVDGSELVVIYQGRSNVWNWGYARFDINQISKHFYRALADAT